MGIPCPLMNPRISYKSSLNNGSPPEIVSFSQSTTSKSLFKHRSVSTVLSLSGALETPSFQKLKQNLQCKLHRVSNSYQICTLGLFILSCNLRYESLCDLMLEAGRAIRLKFSYQPGYQPIRHRLQRPPDSLSAFAHKDALMP